MEATQTIRLVRFSKYDDLIVRISSSNGSTPIPLRLHGVPVSDEEIGRKFREAVLYFLEAETPKRF